MGPWARVSGFPSPPLPPADSPPPVLLPGGGVKARELPPLPGRSIGRAEWGKLPRPNPAPQQECRAERQSTASPSAPTPLPGKSGGQVEQVRV